MSYTGRIDIAALALDPIHHGAGTEGNTVVLRRQEIAREDGTLDLVPFISGNSIRHMIRNAGVLFALEAMGVQPESLSKGVVDLLFSGGSLGGKNSPTTAQAKRIEQMFPVLSLMGYSAGNRIESGRLEVHHLHLVCEENMWRKPDGFSSERWFVPASAQTGSQFGTRHDASRSASASRFLALPASTLDAADKKKGKKNEDSTQMIYDFEVALPRTEWFGCIVYRGLKEQELDALASALSYACDGARGDSYAYRVGAKSGTGFGRMEWRFAGFQRPVEPPPVDPSDVLLPAVSSGGGERLRAYKDRLKEHAQSIIAELEEMAA